MAEAYDVFGGNFETGDTSEFTGSSIEADNTFTATTASKNNGTYGGECAFGGTNNGCYIYKTFDTSQTTIYSRFYFKFNADFSVSTVFDICGHMTAGGTPRGGRIRIGSTLALARLYYFVDAGETYTDTFDAALTFSLDTWYYVEFYQKAATSDGANNGEAGLKINGTTYKTLTELDNDTLLVGRLRLGNNDTATPTNGSKIYYDDIVVNNATTGWPGAYSSTYTVTYDGNENTSGTVPTDASSPYEEAAEVTVLGNTGNLVKSGYVWNGWNTLADGTGTHYDATDTFNMPASNIILYAEWLVNVVVMTNPKYGIFENRIFIEG